eukprot:CAMPEP_0115731258 /NCGR_PEP_ID=MMETSP0272-20121206/84482_1 /TAXON_ID=71861 /ORGANISM="Scrippsiella trochoidea, Strain CCMP3099" /LENGTH=72 /DNA_ID=CAMNT_0003175069 /DNA_START=56 /DNA_END=270 /DNA_ORIENTATION=-
MTNAPSWAPSAKHIPQLGEIDHWRQSVCVLPQPARHAAKGEVLRLVAFHNDEDIWFRCLEEDSGSSIPSPVA